MTILSSPLAPQSDEEITKTEFLKTSTGKEVQVLTFGNPIPSLRKVRSTQKWIKKRYGGTLKLNFEYESDDSDIDVDVKLEIHPNSIPQDCELAMSLDDDTFLSNLDVVFGPHGIQFSQPANLNILVGMEDGHISRSEAENINVYYYNQEAGFWEVMECNSIEFEYDDDQIETIQVNNAKLPHFSRYALCKG